MSVNANRFMAPTLGRRPYWWLAVVRIGLDGSRTTGARVNWPR